MWSKHWFFLIIHHVFAYVFAPTSKFILPKPKSIKGQCFESGTCLENSKRPNSVRLSKGSEGRSRLEDTPRYIVRLS